MNAPAPIAGKLEALPRAREVRPGAWVASCPAHGAHGDDSPSLAWTIAGDGRVLLRCHAGCSTAVVVAALDAAMADLFARDDKPQPLFPAVKRVTALHRAADLTVEALAEAKKLDPALLAERGVRTIRRMGRSAVEVPYLDADRNTIAIRFRDGSGFRWRSGDRVHLYGLERLAAIRAAGEVLLVEGESDCWTADAHGIPALGIPGKATWRAEWAAHLEGLDVLLWQEPDAADLTERVGRALPTARVLVAPPNIKDISAAHIAGHDVSALIAELRRDAPTCAELIERSRVAALDAAMPEILARAEPVLHSPDPLALVKSAIRGLGYGGDVRPVLIVYLAATTRVLRHRLGSPPAHVLLVGPASAGKSHTLAISLAMLPADAIRNMEAGSPRALIYDDAELAHRAVVFPEADSLPAGEDNPAASAIRALLSEGRLAYKVTVRDPETGQFTVHEIDKPGPTVLLTTAVRRLGPQLDSRLFVIEVPDEQVHLRAVLAAQAAAELASATVTRPDIDALVAFQALIGSRAPWDVVVPFAETLAEHVGRNPLSPRITRDFARLLALVKAAAVLRHRQRATDATGRIVAELADYEAVRVLVADIYAGAQSGASARIRATVEAVAGILGEGSSTATVTAVAERLGINKMAASRRTRAAISAGFLINAEEHKGRPARLALGDEMPASDGLPTAADLKRNAVTRLTAGKSGRGEESPLIAAALTIFGDDVLRITEASAA
jgi:hypothetical protein